MGYQTDMFLTTGAIAIFFVFNFNGSLSFFN